MTLKLSRIFVPVLLAVLITIPYVADSATEEQHGKHRSMTGVVIKKGNTLSIKTTDGATFQWNEKASRRHGHEPFKEGDEVTVVVDENNSVIEMHPKGEEGKHQFVTGKLIYMGKMQQEVKLQTSEGEKVFPLAKQETKTKPIAEGTEVTVELNEAGSVIDLHRAK